MLKAPLPPVHRPPLPTRSAIRGSKLFFLDEIVDDHFWYFGTLVRTLIRPLLCPSILLHFLSLSAIVPLN
jgi:hypothetical protein